MVASVTDNDELQLNAYCDGELDLASAAAFERRLAEILEHATAVFYEKGYEGASMRDLSRMSGMSLAGLYYYFESKEKLLYLIQKHYFTTVMKLLREQLEDVVVAVRVDDRPFFHRAEAHSLIDPIWIENLAVD